MKHPHPILSALLVAPLVACTAGDAEQRPGDPEAAPFAAALGKHERLEIFALDPGSGYDGPLEGPDRLRGCRVLGSTVVGEPTDRAAIAQLVLRGLRESDGSLAHCFLPRHGLRVTSEGRVHDFAICYECLTVRAWDEGSATSDAVVLPTAQSVGAELTRRFEALGLKVAP